MFKPGVAYEGRRLVFRFWQALRVQRWSRRRAPVLESRRRDAGGSESGAPVALVLERPARLTALSAGVRRVGVSIQLC